MSENGSMSEIAAADDAVDVGRAVAHHSLAVATQVGDTNHAMSVSVAGIPKNRCRTTVAEPDWGKDSGSALYRG